MTALLMPFGLISCQSSFSPEQALPFDSHITQGQLANGLRYYILPNAQPEQRVYMRLVVNTGSMNEDDDQKGVAHLVEHMAFNGSQKFPKNQIINALEQLGMKFARDINAFTDFENTVYTLNLSNNNEQRLGLALDVINEWMNHLTIFADDLDAERGVVLEEWRARLSPMLRLGDKKSAIEMAGSRYVLRDPIGDVDIIKHVSRQRVNDFYHKWYRPDNMALIIVGDINPTHLQALVKQKLSMENPATQTPLPAIDFSIPLQQKWRVESLSEPEINTPSIELSFFEQANDVNTVAAYRQEFIQQIVLRLINLRLQQWEKQQNAVIESANFYHSHLGKETLQSVFSLQLIKTDYNLATEHLFTFLAELQQHGFSQSELNDEISRLQKLNEKQLKIKAGSLKLADDLIPIVANNQVSLSVNEKYRLNQHILHGLDLAEVNRVFQHMIALPSKLLLITQPVPEKPLPFNAQQIEQRWQKIIHTPLQSWQTQNQSVTMPDLAFKEGSIQQEKYWQKGDITEFRLSNGSKLIYHYSDKSPNQVYFKAVTQGGLRSIPNSDYHLLRAAISVVDDTGIGALSQADINQLFSQNPIAFTTVIDDIQQGFTSASKRNDLENLLKLFRLKLQSSPVSEQALVKYKNETKTYFNQLDKESEFMRKLAKLRFPTAESVYSQSWQRISQLNKQQLEQIYQHYISDKTDFTYFIVGDIPKSDVVALAKKYLANVDIKKQSRPLLQVNIHTPTQPFVMKGLTEPRAEVEIYLTAENKWHVDNEYLLDILGDILQEKLRLVLREEASGIYSVNSWFSQAQNETQIEGKIEFSCDPQRVNELLKLTEHTLDELMEKGVDSHLLAKKTDEKRTALMQQFDSLLVVLGLIEQSYQLTDSPELIYHYQRLNDIVTKQHLDNIAKRALQKQGRFVAVLTQ